MTRGLPVRTESYGTLPVEGASALPEAVELALWCGVSLSEHRTRYLNNASLEDVDLVLGFEPAHVRQAVVDAHASRERTFLMPEFVELLPTALPGAKSEDVVRRARDLVAEAAAGSPASSARMKGGMRDPFGGSWKTYRSTASEIRDLSVALVEGLFGVSASAVLPPVPGRLIRSRKPLWR